MPRGGVLISYFFGEDMIPLGVSCANAFDALGYEAYRFNSQVESRWEQLLLKPVNRAARMLGFRRDMGNTLAISKVSFKRRMLKEVVMRLRPRWVFVIRAHEFVDGNLIRQLKSDCGVERCFAWRIDGPLDSPDLLADAAIYDAYFCSHRHGYDPRKDGIVYLPSYGMDFSIFRKLPGEGRSRFEHDIVLVGGANARRIDFVRALPDLPIDIFGHWGKVSRFDRSLRRRIRAKGAWGQELLRLYSRSKIVLNITAWDPARYVALNQRVFDVPATGAFLLTDYSPEIEEHFRVGVEVECYRSIDELRDKARYYLRHDAEREQIARRGYQRALTLPTIRDRMMTVVQHVGALPDCVSRDSGSCK